MTDRCIFCRITGGQDSAPVLYQDDQVVAIKDIAPQAPHHVLIIPRRHIPTILDLTEADNRLVGHVYQVAGNLARELGFSQEGFRVVVNCNRDGGQAVWHLHFHLLAGRRLNWPPG
jgi:histidine triad (HIT) family protein